MRITALGAALIVIGAAALMFGRTSAGGASLAAGILTARDYLISGSFRFVGARKRMLNDGLLANGEGLAGCLGRFPQLGGAGPGGPRKENENRWDWTECGAGSGEIEINHGAVEAEQLCDPERA